MLKIQHVLPLLLLTGCAVRQPVPATWRLAGRTLMPPGVSSDLPQRTFTAPIRARCALSGSDAIACPTAAIAHEGHRATRRAR